MLGNVLTFLLSMGISYRHPPPHDAWYVSCRSTIWVVHVRTQRSAALLGFDLNIESGVKVEGTIGRILKNRPQLGFG